MSKLAKNLQHVLRYATQPLSVPALAAAIGEPIGIVHSKTSLLCRQGTIRRVASGEYVLGPFDAHLHGACKTPRSYELDADEQIVANQCLHGPQSLQLLADLLSETELLDLQLAQNVTGRLIERGLITRNEFGEYLLTYHARRVLEAV